MFKNISLLVLSLLMASGCTKKQKGDFGLDPGETLRVSLDTEPPTLDWNKSSDTTSSLIIGNLMEGLTNYNLNDPELSLIPGLATEWTATKGATRFTFKIKQGVKWTDGKELVAQHFVDGWTRLLAPATASKYAYFLFGVKNAKPFSEGKILDSTQVGVRANGPYELVVDLEQPMSYFPYLLTHVSTFPIRLDVVNNYGDQWTDPGKIVTLGAYSLKSWEHDKALIMERNPNYFGAPAKIKNILGYIINEKSTVLNLFDSGTIDAQQDLPAIDLPHLKKRAEYAEVNTLGMFYFGFNTKKPPMDNLKVRKAIALAVDKREITNLLGGGQTPLNGWVPKGMFGYEQDLGMNFNPEKARELLDQAGFKDRSKVPTIFLGFNTNENHQRVAENLQAQLKRNLGIKVEIKNEEWKVYLSTLKTDPPHIYRMGWMADFPDPDNFLNLMTSYSDNNHTRWGNKKFDELIEKAVSETNKEKRRTMYRSAQKILLEQDVPVLPIYSMVDHFMVSKRVKNFPLNSLSQLTFKDVELKADIGPQTAKAE